MTPQAALEREVVVGVEEAPVFDAVDAMNAHKLLGTARNVISGGRTLIEFVDLNRDLAREYGIETMAVELSGLIDSGKLDGVKDTLEESLLKKRQARVSMEGLMYLRRAERLLSEASRSLGGISTPGLSLGSSFRLGGPTENSLGLSLVMGFVAIGAITLLAVVLLKNN